MSRVKAWSITARIQYGSRTVVKNFTVDFGMDSALSKAIEKKLDSLVLEESDWCPICKDWKPLSGMSVCDSCEFTYCESHIEKRKTCPICKKRHTK